VPLRQRPGIGTVSNVVVIGLAVDAGLAAIPAAGPWPVAAAMLVGGVALNGVATAAYIGAGLGPGPRDGLMTGLVARTGGSVRVVRTGIEMAVLLVGAALGGTVGAGTVLYAIGIGPLVHALLPRMTVAPLAAPRNPSAQSRYVLSTIGQQEGEPPCPHRPPLPLAPSASCSPSRSPAS
jgi:uncharacterized membrane protein YczE